MQKANVFLALTLTVVIISIASVTFALSAERISPEFRRWADQDFGKIAILPEEMDCTKAMEDVLARGYKSTFVRELSYYRVTSEELYLHGMNEGKEVGEVFKMPQLVTPCELGKLAEVLGKNLGHTVEVRESSQGIVVAIPGWVEIPWACPFPGR